MVENSGEDGWQCQTPARVVYLNNAGQAPLSDGVKEVGIKVIQEAGLMPADTDQNRIRELFAGMIEAESPSDIAIMPSTAFAVTLAARNIQRTSSKKAGRIVVLQDQFNSAIYPWQQICEESNGAITLDIVPHPEQTDGSGWTKSILQRLDAGVIATCLPPLHWSDGTLIDLKAIKSVCLDFDITLVVDATQAAGIMPCSVREVRPAMLACSVHKWLRGPPGTALVYVSPDLHDKWRPLDLHGRGRDMPGGKAWDASKDEMGPHGYPEQFFPDARKFDSGGKPNPILLPMLANSLEQVALLDFEACQKSLLTTVSPLLEWVRKSDAYALPLSSHASHLIGVRPISRTPEETIQLCEQLRDRGIVVAVRCGNIRVSPYLCTTERDITTLIQGLKELA